MLACTHLRVWCICVCVWRSEGNLSSPHRLSRLSVSSRVGVLPVSKSPVLDLETHTTRPGVFDNFNLGAGNRTWALMCVCVCVWQALKQLSYVSSPHMIFLKVIVIISMWQSGEVEEHVEVRGQLCGVMSLLFSRDQTKDQSPAISPGHEGFPPQSHLAGPDSAFQIKTGPVTVPQRIPREPEVRQEGIFISCAPSCLESGCLGTFLDIPTQSTPLWSWLVSFISLLLDISSGEQGSLWRQGMHPTASPHPPRSLLAPSPHPSCPLPTPSPHPAHTLPCLTQALRE